MVAPRGFKASATALARHTGTLMVHDSPQPFDPKTVKGDGVYTWPIISSGASTAVGHI